MFKRTRGVNSYYLNRYIQFESWAKQYAKYTF
jgi:hypothetical protein